MRYIFISSLFVLAFGISTSINACSCVSMVSGNPPCAASTGSPLVFSGRVLSIEPLKSKQKIGEREFEYEERLVKFALMKAYRGSAEQSVEVVTGRGGGDCGYNFEVGRNYLVYTYKHDENRLGAGICGRTQPFERATEDVEYFEGLDARKELGSVFGFVNEYKPRRSGSEAQGLTRLSDVRVTADGPSGVVDVLTDENGKYSFDSLKPGEYTLKFTTPAGLSPENPERKLSVTAKACTTYDVSFSRNNSISGRLLDEKGGPAGKIGVVLVPVEEINKKSQDDVRFIETDENGAFTARTLASGRYYLGFRIDRISGRESDYPPTYYPGTAKIAEAAEIIIGEDTVLENLVFQLRPKLSSRHVEGSIVFPDGKPVPSPNICAEEAGGTIGQCAGANIVVKNGKFSMDLPDGIAYRIRVHIDAGGTQKHAEPVDVAESGPVKNLKLVVSEPNGSCPKCRRN